MLPTLRPVGMAVSPALRLSAAVTASLALHVTAALAPVAAPVGSPTGRPGFSPPLQARIVPAPPQTPSDGRSSPAFLTRAQAAAAPQEPARARQASPPSAAPPREVHEPLGLREAPVYYLPSELDARPRLRSRVDPAYPQVAPPDGGYLVLQLLISETGEVERVRVVVADPEGYFEQAATEAFAAARFSPGRRGGVAVKSQTWIEMKFHPLAPSGEAAPGTKPNP